MVLSTNQSIVLFGSVICGSTCRCRMTKTLLASPSSNGNPNSANQHSWKTFRCAWSVKRGGSNRFRSFADNLGALLASSSSSSDDESKTPVLPSSTVAEAARAELSLRFFLEDWAEVESLEATGAGPHHSLTSEATVGMAVRSSRRERRLEAKWGGTEGEEAEVEA